jgi:hypothetical protein
VCYPNGNNGQNSSQKDSQINIINPQFLQAGVQRGGDVGDVRQHFGHDVEFVARDAGFLDSYTELGLRFVDFGAVEVVVAEADGGFGAVDADLVEDGLVALLVPGSAGAEGELWVVLVGEIVMVLVLVLGWRGSLLSRRLTMGMLVPSFSLRLGIGVWMLAIVLFD